ncbi:hypothetical protein TNIN_281201 [Trichonephila inaurata madagascariensis]|uniref:Uncharacterized protein n=1 Tax=Trichonephila inaurata madagascariensis TaxID=2747483 RepID=A0A8X6YTB4_9ARAC|nr:hypothetical protein TNIN_281201 [Trichonephila inaurata madagascariensis]
MQFQVSRMVVEGKSGPLWPREIPHGPCHAITVQVLSLPLIGDVLGPGDEVDFATRREVHLAREDCRVADKARYHVFST